MWTHNPRWSWINRFNMFEVSDTRWAPQGIQPYWTRLVYQRWTGPLILWLVRHEELPTEFRWMTWLLWNIVRATGGHIDMRAMPGGYAKASGSTPFEFSWDELRQSLKSYAFVSLDTSLDNIYLYVISGMFNLKALTPDQRHSLCDQLIDQLLFRNLIEVDPDKTAAYGYRIFSTTPRGRNLAGWDDVEVKMVPEEEPEPQHADNLR